VAIDEELRRHSKDGRAWDGKARQDMKWRT